MSDHITLVGNIVGDLEQRATRGGGSVAAFRLAVGERRLDRERGEWVDAHTNYYSVSVFGELGANALRSLRKGERVVLSGRLRLREWETETKRGVSADVVADAIGHDLRWGTTRFERTPKPSASADPAPSAALPGGGSSEAEWSVPGTSGEPIGVPAAVGAGASGESGPTDDATPF
ncbi:MULTISPECIES: single-stranded DNA-binding protein [Microbacterium]|uniref:single-stranded DNA-binding protein n=1 Tax=Microbacterium TaxID=33882 RepID=UPI00278200EA|nr:MULTISPECIES: single-stranded DNA-binding protein [Microbacterium]MDQ1084050.1 single-strand DNA-binding protein [Microbacterium sp. SORGH_AS_0344]MDQ1170671.1 single-strand DNA-binding protein [Microbacterium proteolyticum]